MPSTGKGISQRARKVVTQQYFQLQVPPTTFVVALPNLYCSTEALLAQAVSGSKYGLPRVPLPRLRGARGLNLYRCRGKPHIVPGSPFPPYLYPCDPPPVVWGESQQQQQQQQRSSLRNQRVVAWNSQDIGQTGVISVEQINESLRLGSLAREARLTVLPREIRHNFCCRKHLRAFTKYIKILYHGPSPPKTPK